MTESEIIESHFRKLDDIRNTAQSLMEKIGQLQADLFNNPDKELEKSLNEVNNAVNESYQIIEEVVTDYENNKVGPSRS
ncbi:MAG: hypothetical protein ACFCUM_03690 [Bacteroidales bacterium]|jgi:DNA-binding protein H-NS